MARAIFKLGKNRISKGRYFAMETLLKDTNPRGLGADFALAIANETFNETFNLSCRMGGHKTTRAVRPRPSRMQYGFVNMDPCFRAAFLSPME